MQAQLNPVRQASHKHSDEPQCFFADLLTIQKPRARVQPWSFIAVRAMRAALMEEHMQTLTYQRARMSALKPFPTPFFVNDDPIVRVTAIAIYGHDLHLWRRKIRSSTSTLSTNPRKGLAMDAIALLKKDHTTVRGLLAELESTTARGVKTRIALLEKIASEIKAHASIEEEIFYPAFKAAGKKKEDEKMYFEALEEHRAAGDLVLNDLLGTDPASEKFSGRAKVLNELIKHHAGEEEKEMFPRAKELLSKQELASLGEQMAARKEQLLAAMA